jgi:hypothetical protein
MKAPLFLLTCSIKAGQPVSESKMNAITNNTNSTVVDTNTYVWASNGLPYDGNKANIQAYLAEGLIKVIKGLVIKIDSSTYKACVMFYSPEIGNHTQMSLVLDNTFSCERQSAEWLIDWYGIEHCHIVYKELYQILDDSSLITNYRF